MLNAITVFLSAFLLFLVQPMIAKHVLPWFGGTPAVWATCLVFFQSGLLAGYAYAFALDRLASARAQARVHAAVLLGALAVVAVGAWAWGGPLLPPRSWAPGAGDAPAPRLLGLLLAGVGVPFVVLSATSPLLQRWASLREPGRSPYRLYALSNAGSLVGLVAYPFVVEPALSLPAQAAAWAAAFGLAAVGCVGVAGVGLGQGGRGKGSAEGPQELARPASAPGSAAKGSKAVTRAEDLLLWLLLPACTSALLVAVTNQLTLEVAAVPFLWVLPLTLYLLSFILCFDSPRWYARGVFVPAAALTTVAALILGLYGVYVPMSRQILALGALLFLLCTLGHGELARAKPEPRRLTLYYLAMAGGGALGGAFVALAAPVLFHGLWEFHVAVLAAWCAVAWALYRDRTSPFHTGDPACTAALLGLVVYVALRTLPDWVRAVLPSGWGRPGVGVCVLAAGLAVGAGWALLRCGGGVRWRAGPRLLVVFVILFAELFLAREVRRTERNTVETRRNFYGLVRVQRRMTDDGALPVLQLTHGQINHGFQIDQEGWSRRPGSYYAESSGVGVALACHARRHGLGGLARGLRIGVTGLGAGGMAAHAREGDSIRFYEINPAVVELAAGPRARFAFVRDCPGEVSVAMGDARLALEREAELAPGLRFDVLVLDAFSSDSVPVHLLTLEAFRAYAACLRDGESVIAVNISNRFLDLRPVVFGAAEALGLRAQLVIATGDPPQPLTSHWVVLSRSAAFAERVSRRVHVTPYAPPRRGVWTDAHSSLFGLLR
jgi:hypothetical protein